MEKSLRCIPLPDDEICFGCFNGEIEKEVTGLRDPQALNPLARAKLGELEKLAAQRGLEFKVISTLRTEKEQLAYFAQGRKPLAEVNRLRAEAGLAPIAGKENRVVTRNLTSIHQFGLAFDVALITPPAPLNLRGAGGVILRGDSVEGNSRGDQAGLSGEEIVWDTKADLNDNHLPDYEELGKIGESLGLRWGGRFRFRDYGHFEYTGGLSLADLKAGKRPAG